MTIITIILLLFSTTLFSQVNNPESVVWNEAIEAYIVSDAGSGKLVKYTERGEVEDFTTGLTQPKGITMSTLSLWVTDVNELVEVDILTGDIINKYPIEGATFLNDIASDPFGFLYISDMQTNKIYRFDELSGEYEEFSKGQLNAPNGILFDFIGGLIVVSFSSNNAKIYTVDVQEGNVNELYTTSLGQLDGIAYDSKRDRYYISSWTSGAVYIFDAAFIEEPELLIDGLNGPADIYYDDNKDRLVIPEMNTGEIIFYEFNSTDVDEFVMDDILIYPNPVKDVLSIQSDRNFESIQIYNITGVKVKNINNLHLQNIDLSDLNAGIYIINMFDGRKYEKKLITVY